MAKELFRAVQTAEEKAELILQEAQRNVRELLNRVRRAAVVAEHALIEPGDLQLDAATARVVALDDHRDRTDRDALLAALHATGGNVSACAQRLRISRMTVYRLCRKHGIAPDTLR